MPLTTPCGSVDGGLGIDLNRSSNRGGQLGQVRCRRAAGTELHPRHWSLRPSGSQVRRQIFMLQTVNSVPDCGRRQPLHCCRADSRGDRQQRAQSGHRTWATNASGLLLSAVRTFEFNHLVVLRVFFICHPGVRLQDIRVHALSGAEDIEPLDNGFIRK